jgi:3-hydroxymyristoyl/3-hydroxydecanoyl-(acyl carrier protein) dehydratase
MPWLPAGIRVLEWSREGRRARGVWEVAADCPCFRGHFEGEPILPGITHLALVTDAAARLSGREAVLVEVKSLRLRRPVLPGDRIEGTIDGPEGGGLFRFDLRVGTGSAASGVVTVEAAGV